jgi:hypothetical protein
VSCEAAVVAFAVVLLLRFAVRPLAEAVFAAAALWDLLVVLGVAAFARAWGFLSAAPVLEAGPALLAVGPDAFADGADFEAVVAGEGLDGFLAEERADFSAVDAASLLLATA